MSGLGPAACWLTHKRIESWSRMAKERVGVVKRGTIDRSSNDKSTTSTYSINNSGELGEITVNDLSTLSGGVSQTPLQQQSHPTQQAAQSMTTPPSASSMTSTTSGIGSCSDSCELNTDSEQESNLNNAKEGQPIQSTSQTNATKTINAELLRGPADFFHTAIHLQHQSRSFPPRLQRTPSISSQSSVDGVPAGQSRHRCSSPHIRTFGPDGRSSLPTETPFVSYLLRSPGLLRATSTDVRTTGTTGAQGTNIYTPLTSQSNTILSTGGVTKNNCVSQLFIPPSRLQVNMEPAIGPASPLGAIQPDLYRGPDGPIYLNAPTTNSPLGRLHLRVQYDYHVFDLIVHIIEAQNLSPVEEGGFRDPYVRLNLEPEVDNRKRQTLIHRAVNNPYFDQQFKFPVSRDQLTGKQLILQVLDYDRYSHNDIIGEVRIAIDELDLSKSIEIWGDLIRARKPTEHRPELLCSLNYLPQAERLTIVIMKAKNLDLIHECYVKIYFIQNGKRVKKKKTSISKSVDPANPIWNEAFTFNLQSQYLQQTAIEIYMVGTCGENPEIGSIGLGPQETGTGCQHWHDMINNARKPTAMWHFIR